jgi:thiamine-phosphate pyrophosphorylase
VNLPKIYPITDVRISGLSHAEQVAAFARAGAAIVQLREKNMSPRQFFEAAREAIRVAHEHGVRIIINDRVDLALALGADGAHLGENDLPPAAARAILGPNAIIGFSTHSVEQAVDAISLPVDYIAIGPVFATRTKENPDDVVGIDGVKAVRAAIGEFPLVAIGGIDLSSVHAVIAAGADSAAIVSALLSPLGKIEDNFVQFAKRC